MSRKSQKFENRRIIAGVLLALVFGLIIGMLIAEYKLQRFGDMVCREKYGYHYRFMGFHDAGTRLSYNCGGLWGEDPPSDLRT